ncbi:aKG-HExxH-type peptide beta-hydroxylase [Pedobacter psychrodurus]|uniref:aKG-HExxH-type peptide beta-hydroxylase n=1 Tax=Pedobacter psychrodurus TaxID=2530456 RepID=UPI00292F6C71|nr:HEXXH motif-containing putative peptide modification protein [Pedobacter psychrodurus]
MKLLRNIKHFLKRPLPLWDLAIANELVGLKWRELVKQGKIGENACYHSVMMLGGRHIVDHYDSDKLPYGLPIEIPDVRLNHLYLEHGLDVLGKTEMDRISASEKVSSAFARLLSVGECGESVALLVKAVQLLRQPEPEFDVSYSHPAIPFTIFVSVGEDSSEIESLRLSESILHEAMHLLLTLVEEQVILVRDNESTYYSPWRETERPVRGVLHGMFVFRAVLDYYLLLLKELKDFKVRDFAEFRIEQITAELLLLNDFAKCGGLTEDGASLAAGLLP